MACQTYNLDFYCQSSCDRNPINGSFSCLVLFMKQSPPVSTHTHTDTCMQRHTNKSSSITHYRDVDTWLKTVGSGEQTELLLRSVFKTLKASQCCQSPFSLALVAFPLLSLQNPSLGTSKTVLPWKLFSTGILSSRLYLFSARPFLYSLSHEEKCNLLLDFPIWILHPSTALWKWTSLPRIYHP